MPSTTNIIWPIADPATIAVQTESPPLQQRCGRALTKKEKAVIVRDLPHKSARALAIELGVSLFTVRIHLARSGLRLPYANRGQEFFDRLWSLHQNGTPVKTIAHELKASAVWVAALIRARGGHVFGDRGRGYGPRQSSQDFNARCLDLYRQGYGIRAMARKLGCHTRPVLLWRRRHNLPPIGMENPLARKLYSESAKARVINGRGVVHLLRAQIRELSSRYNLPAGTPRRGVPAVLALLSGPRTAASLAVEIGLSRTAVYRCLSALRSLGLVVSIPGNRYMLTGRCMDLLSQPAGASP